VSVTNTAVKTAGGAPGAPGATTVTSSTYFKTAPSPTGTGAKVVPTGQVQFTGGSGKTSGGMMAAVVAFVALVL